MLNGNAGHFRDALGLHMGGAELLACPHVHRLARHAQFLGSVGQAAAGNFGEDGGHRVADFVDGHAHFALQRGRQANRQGFELSDEFDLFH